MIYVVYARHIPQQYIYMEFTWYIQTIYLVGVPDALGWRFKVQVQVV
jgi:hypothetical protein